MKMRPRIHVKVDNATNKGRISNSHFSPRPTAKIGHLNDTIFLSAMQICFRPESIVASTVSLRRYDTN